MENFPLLQKNEVVLLRAMIATGHVLDENFILINSDDQKMFSPFATIDEAKKYIEEMEKERTDVEFVVYDRDQNVLLSTIT